MGRRRSCDRLRLWYNDRIRSSALHGAARLRDEGLEDTGQLLLVSGLKLARGTDPLEELGVVRPDVHEELLLELADLTGHHPIEIASHTREDDTDLFVSSHGDLGYSLTYELLLLEELGQLGSTVEQLLGGGVQIRTELGEGGDLSVLGELQFELTGDLLHGLDLCCRTDSAD